MGIRKRKKMPFHKNLVINIPSKKNGPLVENPCFNGDFMLSP